MDIFEFLNHLNLLLQSRNTNRINDYNAIRVCIAKLRLWQRRVQKGNAASFPSVNAALEKRFRNLEDQLKLKIAFRLQRLKQDFECCFSDVNNTEFRVWMMTRHPFCTTEGILPNNLQEKILKIKFNSTAKDDFEHMPLNKFKANYTHIYENVGNAAIQTLYFFFAHLPG